jgi:hypothetical protein
VLEHTTAADPCRVLETHGNKGHNPQAVLAMHRHPDAYRREQ